MEIKRLTFKWAAILLASATILILRVIDFALEAVNQNFHMTRAGLDIMGPNALIIQLAIILTSALIIWKASEKLSNLHFNSPAK